MTIREPTAAQVIRYTSRAGPAGEYGVLVDDGDDGYLVKRPLSLPRAESLLETLCELAPFRWHEILEFGYTQD